MKFGLVAGAVAVAGLTFSAHAENVGGPGNVQTGRGFAMTHCSQCHVVLPSHGVRRPSGRAPDFSDIAQMPSMTGTALLVFLHSPHPTMPSLVLSDRDANNVIAYILSLKKRETGY